MATQGHGTTLIRGGLGLLFFAAFAAAILHAQTYTVIHNFSGGQDGAMPMAGLTMDRAGNLYGTANFGGNTGGSCAPNGCGVVYRLTKHNSSWILSPLYSFVGGNDGMNPRMANVLIGSDGTLYSSTYFGGGSCDGSNQGCGTVFKLQPPANACHSVICSWSETILHSFNGADGAGPVGALVFDQQGNLDGTTNTGSFRDGGTAYQLVQSSGWMEMILRNLYGYPGSSVSLDHAGNLYGTTFIGNDSPGTVYQLAFNGLNWIGTDIYDFGGGDDGGYPNAGVILDSAGNLYGATTAGGSGRGGTVFELTPSDGGWTYNVLYSFTGRGSGTLIAGPVGNLLMDSSGNLYGTTFADGALGYGAVFKLTHTDQGWTYTSLHDFTGGTDGSYPYSNLIFDGQGNLYGTASSGGGFGRGVIFQIIP